MKRLALAIVLVLGFVPPAWADFEAGLAAYNRGDYATALREFRPLAEQGDATALFNLGFMYRYGQGVPQNDAEAVKWYRRAAEQGDADAQFILGVIYSIGRGVPQDYAEAVKWYRRAAEQGDADAQNNLGVMYDNGQGVPQDYAEAVKWYRRAAEQGDADAQNNLGLMYDKGQGVPQNYAEAVKWYRLAAEQGAASAQFNLGLMYDKGQGVPQDYAEALKWYRRAAEQGNAKAQTNLGVMYGGGQGIPQDYVQAHKWYNLAASRFPSGETHDRAVKNRDIVAAKMTAAQIAEAQRLARDWKPKTQAAPTPPLIDYARLVKESEIREVQLNLATLGYKPGPADGILGSRTRSAIEAFQRDQGLPATGEVSNEILLLLMWKMALQKSDLAPTKVEPSD